VGHGNDLVAVRGEFSRPLLGYKPRFLYYEFHYLVAIVTELPNSRQWGKGQEEEKMDENIKTWST
jgi:hypothetical protein